MADAPVLEVDPSATDYQQDELILASQLSGGEAGPSLRLTGQDHGESAADESVPNDDWTQRDTTPAVGVAEAIMLGNLPGMSGPWLTQYGQLLAQQDGGVAILHLDLENDAIDLELIEPTAHQAKADEPEGSGKLDFQGSRQGPSLRIPPGGYAGRDLVEVLDQLNRSRVSPVRTVLLHVDPTPNYLPYLLDTEYWTLLSGADDAAIVAGYRLLKQLLESDERVARAHVGLMVVGSDQEAGQHAAGKLRTAVANFLQTPIELIGFQEKMIPARCRTLGRFEGLGELWPRLTAWIEALVPPTPVEPLGETFAAAETPRQPEPVAKQPKQARPAPRVVIKPEAVPTSAVVSVPLNNPAADEPKTPTLEASEEVDLFELIDTDPHTTASIPGGLALEARCPSQPHTQLALDATGRLHLLHRHDSADGDPPTPKEAIVELVAVRDWARQHRQLLQLTERGRRFDADADPVLHLFTDRADLSVHLVARLGDLLKLHLLRDVAVGDQHTFFCTPLSA